MLGQISKGSRITVPAYGSAVVGGAIVLIGSLFGIAIGTIASGGDLVLETFGVFESQPKATGETWAIGDALYWDATNSVFTKTATNNKRVGFAMSVQATGDTIGTVRIGSPGAI